MTYIEQWSSAKSTTLLIILTPYFLTNSTKKTNKLINIDLKNLSNWLNANKISLNVKKTETIIFKCRRKNYEGVIKLKLYKQRLHPTNNVKYLGIKIDENFNWKHHVNDASTKLLWVNTILINKRNYICQFKNTKVHLFCYFWISLKLPFFCLDTKIWLYQTSSILQKKVLRIINFKPRNIHTSPLLKENVILKLYNGQSKLRKHSTYQ